MPIDDSAIPTNREARRHPDKVMAGRRWANVPETAAYLGVAPHTIRYMLGDGRIKGYRGMGSRMLRIDLNEVDTTLLSD